jgi:tRNA-2-methylthio-N6-dimethylallyladenosine synthase
MPKVFIKTYGCQMNERDSEAVAAQLVAKGYALAGDELAADVVLVNTCSVRDLAEQKALHKMEFIAGSARSRRSAPVLGFMGCMAQSRGEKLIDLLPDVDLVVGTQKAHRVAEYLDDLLAGRRDKIVDVAEEEGSESALSEHLSLGTGPAAVSVYVAIMQGCNQHCSFCIVPQTRGAERCRPIPEIVAEVRGQVERGAREVTLLGQIVNSYGRRDYPVVDGKSAFVQLLEAVHETPGLERIRFTSPHPKGYGDDLIDAFRRLPKLVEHAHLPAQSGSDRILRLMRRGYTRDRFLAIVEKLRGAAPDMGVTTDLIVGFPGETDQDFEETLSLCRAAAFDQAYVFKYSTRQGTVAASMPDQIPDEVIEQRHRVLLDEVNAIASRGYAAQVGRTVQVLVDGPSKRNEARWQGRTRSNKLVLFPGVPRLKGHLLDMQVERAGNFTLYADPALAGFAPSARPANEDAPPISAPIS